MKKLFNRRYTKVSVFLFFFLSNALSVKANSVCLPGWDYRVAMILENSSQQVLTDQQLTFEVNTLQLISEGKMRQQGMDIRFLSSNDQLLPYWIDETTYNTTATKVWVRVPYIGAATQDTIYMFYGNKSAPASSDGDATFLFFDDFNDAALDTEKWNSCGGASIVESEGMLTIQSGDVLFSQHTFADTLDVHVEVNSIDPAAINSVFVMSATDSSGYGMTLNQTSATDAFRSTIFMSNGTCIEENTGLTPPSGSASSGGNTLDSWNFQWLKDGTQHLFWETGNLTLTDNSVTYPSEAHKGLGEKIIADVKNSIAAVKGEEGYVSGKFQPYLSDGDDFPAFTYYSLIEEFKKEYWTNVFKYGGPYSIEIGDMPRGFHTNQPLFGVDVIRIKNEGLIDKNELVEGIATVAVSVVRGIARFGIKAFMKLLLKKGGKKNADEVSDVLYGIYRGNRVKVESRRIDFYRDRTPEELRQLGKRADEIVRPDSWPIRPKSGKPVAGGFKHTTEQHFNRPLEQSRSIFSTTQERLKEVINSPKVINSKLIDSGNGIYYRIVDVEEIIGNSALKFGGGQTSHIKVFTDIKGVYINSFPVPKPKP